LNKELDKFIQECDKFNLKLIGKKSDSLNSTLVLLRKVKAEINAFEKINISYEKYEEWVEILKEKIENNRNSDQPKNLWLIANDSPLNGIIGLVNCLRAEPGGNNIRCIFDYDSKLPVAVDLTKSPYNQIIKSDLLINVYKNGKWGTFRHIKMSEQQETIMTEHAYLNVVTRGDMSSLKWFDAPHKYFPTLTDSEKKEQEVLCNVYYSALNFKVNLLKFNLGFKFNKLIVK
jgi:fatty acid synthase, animal type